MHGGGGNPDEQLDPNLLTFHEKADELVEEEEELAHRREHVERVEVVLRGVAGGGGERRRGRRGA